MFSIIVYVNTLNLEDYEFFFFSAQIYGLLCRILTTIIINSVDINTDVIDMH